MYHQGVLAPYFGRTLVASCLFQQSYFDASGPLYSFSPARAASRA